MDNRQDRIDALDGLRALAILLVLLGHSVLFVYFSKGPKTLVFGSEHVTWFLLNGWTGVNLFFVLSGFLIARQLLPVAAAPHGWRAQMLGDYARRRFFRIVPAYYVVLLASMAAQLSLETDTNEWLWRLFCYLFFLQDYTQQTVFAQFWSLAVEMQFYLMAPFLVIALFSLGMKTRCAAFTALMAALLFIKVVTAVTVPPVNNESVFLVLFRAPLHMSLDSLIAGVAACFLWQEARLRPLLEKPLWSNLIFAAGAVIFIVLTAFIPPHFLSYPRPVTMFAETGYFIFLSLAFGAMLLGLLGGGIAGRLFSARPLRVIAALSYSMYLIHILLARPALDIARAIVPAHSGPTLAWCIYFLIFLLMTLVPAALMYRYIERPFNRWAHRPG